MNPTLTHLDLIPHLHPELIGALAGAGLLIWGIGKKKKKKEKEKTA